MMQKRNASRECKRSSTVPRYEEYYKSCHNQRFTEDDQLKTDILKDLPPTTEKSKLYDYRSWARYIKLPSGQFRFYKFGESYFGHFGSYIPENGYFQEFLPYDQTRDDYLEIIKDMRSNKYIELGKTKMIDIDYTICIPHL